MKRAHAPAAVDSIADPGTEYDPRKHASWSARTQEPPGDVLLAGYRVVRRLASGPRADLYLGHSSAPGVAPVVLKVFRPEADGESIEREINALCGAPVGRFVRLIDVATLPDSRVCLVQERLDSRSLGRFLQERTIVTPGEAVTILAPIVATLADLHGHGLAHGCLGQGSILLRSSGRPVLAGLGSLVDLPNSPSARIGLLREDYARLARLLHDVFGHLDGATDRGAARRARRIEDDFRGAARATPFRECLGELEHALFEWSVPAPLGVLPTEPTDTAGESVAGETPTGDSPTGLSLAAARPGRHRLTSLEPGPTIDAESQDAESRDEGVWTWDDPAPEPHDVDSLPGAGTPAGIAAGSAADRRRLGGVGRASALSGRLQRMLEAHPLLSLRRRVSGIVRARRRPVLLAGLVAGAGLILALTLIPPSGDASRGQDGRAPARPGAAAATPATPAPATPAPATPAPATPAHWTAAHSTAPEALPDDPVLAVSALLAQRSACLEAVSVVCLDAVDQSGSAAMKADSATVTQAQQGGPGEPTPAYEAWTPTLVERTGNMALVSLVPSDARVDSKPASVLVVKGEAGWRLREIFTQ